MSQALYRKYRSRSFDEIVGQKGVVTALKNALANNALSHAYLFTGPRGVGKTSIARIFAYAINNVPYNSDDLPVDIIEVDAASNRGIDEVRDLRDKVRIAPVAGPYKIYIIDEVHMLTSHAFNALLKTLEEPPSHVVFILATTESHKLPETITSRTQRYNFTLASADEITDHLKEISKKESLDIDAEALSIIAKHSGGSLRDALSLLDHARHLGTKITAEDVRQNIGMPSDEVVEAIITAIINNDASEVMKELHFSESGAISAIALAKAITDYITQSIQDGTSQLSLSVATKLLHSLVEVETSTQQDVKLRIALLSALTNEPAQPRLHKTIAAPIVQSTTSIAPPPKKETRDYTNVVSTPVEPIVEKSLNLEPVKGNITSAAGVLTKEAWGKVLEDIRKTHNTLYSVLRMAQLGLDEVSDNKLVLNFAFPFHQKRINEMKNKDIIGNKLSSLGYGNFEIVCGLTEKGVPVESAQPSSSAESEDKDAVLHQIRGVFGSAEVLE